MKDIWTRIIILGLLAVVVGVPFLLRPDDESTAATASAGDDSNRLVVISPHNEQIRYELERAFNAERVRAGKPAIVFDWRTSGGTSDLRKQVLSELEAEYRNAQREQRPAEAIGYDLFFGGGAYDHSKLAKGIEHPTGEQRVPGTEQIDLSEAQLKAVFPEAVIGGEPLYHPDRRWVGTALSSFGIVFNRDVLQILEMPHEPRTWSDLYHEKYYRWIALADPAHSGSIATTYNAILRRHGWTEGWALLRQVFANSRYFAESSSKVPVDVANGDAVAGMCIDFYGRFESGAIGPGKLVTDQPRVGYVDPPLETEMSADPISIIHMAPHRELADQFVAWMLTPQAQRLWQRRVGSEGGPVKYELRRLPVRRDLYTAEEMASWVDKVNPFELAKPYVPGMVDFRPAVGPLSHAMAIDILKDLNAAWRAILDNPDHPRIDEMRRLFHVMPADLTLDWGDPELEANWKTIIENPGHEDYAKVVKTLNDFMAGVKAIVYDKDKALEARLRWTAEFRGNYRKVVEMSRG